MSMQQVLDRLGQNNHNDNNNLNDSKRHGGYHQSSSTGTGDNSHREGDCSWCDEFDRGPCRIPFRLWMRCCDYHPETYTETCQKTFQNFHKCLERSETK